MVQAAIECVTYADEVMRDCFYSTVYVYVKCSASAFKQQAAYSQGQLIAILKSLVIILQRFTGYLQKICS